MISYCVMGSVFTAALAFGLASRAGELTPDAAAKVVNEDLAKCNASGFVMQQVKDKSVAQAFPKHIFFGVYFRQFPVARLTPKGMSNSNLYAVGQDGKANLLQKDEELHGFFKKNLGATKEVSQAKDAARAFVRLLEELHQDGFYKFALQDDSTKVDVTNEGMKATARSVVMAGGNGELKVALGFDQAGRLQTITDTVALKPGPRPICQATKLLDADAVVRRMAERDLVIMGRAARAYLDEQRLQAAPELRRAIDRIWEMIVAEDR